MSTPIALSSGHGPFSDAGLGTLGQGLNVVLLCGAVGLVVFLVVLLFTRSSAKAIETGAGAAFGFWVLLIGIAIAIGVGAIPALVLTVVVSVFVEIDAEQTMILFFVLALSCASCIVASGAQRSSSRKEGGRGKSSPPDEHGECRWTQVRDRTRKDAKYPSDHT